jgi:hypothetical protein
MIVQLPAGGRFRRKKLKFKGFQATTAATAAAAVGQRAQSVSHG